MNPVPVPVPVPVQVPRARWLGAVGLSLLLGAATLAHAQADAEDASSTSIDESDASGAKLTPDEAARVLAQALPDAPDARYAAWQRQYRAAQLLEDRPRGIGLARQLADAGRGRVEGETWIAIYLNAEFPWGSQGKALEACEPFLADKSLSIGARAVPRPRAAAAPHRAVKACARRSSRCSTARSAPAAGTTRSTGRPTRCSAIRCGDPQAVARSHFAPAASLSMKTCRPGLARHAFG